jgi:ATP-dependent Clp protease protease subunit
MPIKFWQFRNTMDEATDAELLLYGPISDTTWFGDETTPKQFNSDLGSLGDVKQITVRINSPGGDVFAATAIYNALKNHPATINTYVDGLAASAASVVAMAGDTVTMPTASMMMIHNPQALSMGDARDMRSTADVLDKVRDVIIAAYQSKTGKERGELIGLMNSETWMTAQDAVDRGFADKIDDQQAVTASMRGRLMIVNGLGFDVKQWRTVPTNLVGSDEGTTSEQGDTIGADDSAAKTEEVSIMADNESIVEQEPIAEPTADDSAAEDLEELASDEQEQIEVDAIQEAITNERKRAASIRALSVPGCEAVTERAIADGLTVEAAALLILNSEDFRNADRRAARLRDAAAVDGVTPTSGTVALTDELITNMTGAELKARMPEIEAYYQAKRKGGK